MIERAVLAIAAPVLLLAGLLPALPAAAESAPAPTQGAMDSANWHWAEKTPNGDVFQKYAPLIEVRVGPTGSSVWAGDWALPQQTASALSLRFSGVPAGVAVKPAGFPMSVPKEKRAQAVSCRRAGADVVCDLRAPAGLEGTTAVALSGTIEGRHSVTATLLQDGVAVPKADEGFFLEGAAQTPNEFFVTREGQALVTAGQPQVHKIAAYRMSGDGPLRLKGVVAKRLRDHVKVKGHGWECRRNTCSLQRHVAVGERAPALGMLWMLNNADVRGWPAIENTKAHSATWWTRYTGGRLRQDSSLIPVAHVNQPKPKKPAQILSPHKRAMLTAQVEQLGPARIGGDGRYSVKVGNGGSRAAKSVRVEIEPPSHAQVTRIQHDKKWTCQGATCRWNGVLQAKKILPPLTVLLLSKGHKASTEPFVAVASWAVKGRRKSDRGVERTKWLAPLKVSASTTNRVVHSASGINTQLTAKISNGEGSQVHYRWKQLAGPDVQWVSPTAGAVNKDTANARFTPPKVTQEQTLKFRVTATGAGAKAQDTVSIKVVPSGDKTTWEPRKATTVPPTPVEVAKRLNRKASPNQPLQTKPAFIARINHHAHTEATAGKRVDLRLTQLRGAAVRKVTWQVDEGPVPERMKPRVRKEGTVLSLRIPRTRQKPLRVTALVALGRGRRVDIGELVVVDPPAKQQHAHLAVAPTTLCQIFGNLTANETFTIGGLTLTASEVSQTGSSCTDTTATVTVGAAPFTVDGATITGMTLAMTSSNVTAAVTSVQLPGTDYGISVSGSLTASWSGSFSGTLTAANLQNLPYLPLPDGWAVSTATISFAGASLSLSVTATGPDEGQAVVSGALADDSFSLDVSVTNAVTITGYDGSQAAFSGSGSIARSSGATTYDINLGMSTTSFDILDDVSLQSASLDWSNSGLSLNGGVTATIGSDSVAFTATAQITDASDWTATITSTATPSVGTLPLASLSGTFGYASKSFTFDVAASVSNVDVSNFLGLDIATASATIANDGGDLELDLAVAGSVDLFSDTITVDTTVDVDIKTGKFDADFSLAGANFGPAQAQLNSVNFFIADDGSADPALTGNPCLPSGTTGTVYGFTATATILSNDSFQVTGVYQGGTKDNPAGSGYCFYGQLASSSVSELNGTGVADSLNFLYATYATTASGASIPATSPTMWATMALPQQVQTYLNNDVTGFTVMIELVTTSGKVTGLTINGDVDMSAFVSGSATSLPSFELTSIGVSLELTLGSATNVELSFDCDGVLTTPGNSVGSMTQSTMNFKASIGLDFGSGSDGGSLDLSANLTSNAPVQNAFGVSGLVLQNLGVSAVIGFDALLNSSLTFSATNLELPSNVADAIGLSSTAPIDFSLTVGLTAPCFYISIGTPDQTTNAAIDWGGAGVLEAYYFKLLLAPLGNCTEADGTQIQGNFAVDFTGYIFGVSVYINGMVEIVPDFAADLNVDIAGFNLAGLGLNQTIIDIDFQPSAGVFNLDFSGGANLWSTVVIQVSGTVDIDLSATKSSFDIQFDGSMDANLFSVFQSDVWVDLGVDAGIDNGSFYLNELDVSLGGLVKVLIFEANASFTIDYQNGGVQVLSGSFGANVNLFLLQFGVNLSFVYDPAVTGNQDLAITIGGYVEIDLFIFDVRVAVSLTIDVDASFLGGSEYHPQPVQQVSAPTSLVSSQPNTNPNTWNWNSGMYQGNNFGWMANLSGYPGAIMRAGDGGELGGYYPTSGAGQTPSPADVAWIQSTIWPGAYTANQTTARSR